MEVSGKAVKYGHNINTDLIIPGKYLVLTDPSEMAKHAMEGLEQSFTQKSQEGVVMVVGHNFGSGSSREQAPIALILWCKMHNSEILRPHLLSKRNQHRITRPRSGRFQCRRGRFCEGEP